MVTKRTAIEASTLYDDNTLMGEDIKVTLPEITNATADVSLMGTASIPLLGLIEDMEFTISKQGVDKKATSLTRPCVHNIEVRWVQDTITGGGNVAQEGCKAYIKCIPKSIGPVGAEIEVGNTPEFDIPYEVLRYRLVVNGEEVLLVDRTSHILKDNGKDRLKFSKYL